MIVAINGKSLGDPAPGGAVRSARSIVLNMAAEYPESRFDVYVPGGRDADSWAKPQNITIIPAAIDLSRGSLRRSIWEQCVLPGQIADSNKPYRCLLNLTNSLPLRSEIPQIVLVHDAGFMRADWFSRGFGYYVRTVLGLAARNDLTVVTVSKSSKKAIQAAMPKLKKISVIYNSIDDAVLTEAHDSIGDVHSPYFLFLGSANPRKNMAGALAGFHEFCKSHDEDVKLLVAGSEKPIFQHQQKDPTVPNNVCFLGYVSDPEKWYLLRGAVGLLFPSFDEGFGLPVAEALQVGTRVIVSRLDVMQELFGEAPIYIDPFDTNSIAKGIANAYRLRSVPLPDSSSVCRRFDKRHNAQQYQHLIDMRVPV